MELIFLDYITTDLVVDLLVLVLLVRGKQQTGSI